LCCIYTFHDTYPVKIPIFCRASKEHLIFIISHV
jgi:hypothetical protein